jgi:uncharacterized cupredoxin-like copper-binding protein
MPIPFLAARGSIVAAGVLSVLAATASVTAARAHSMHDDGMTPGSMTSHHRSETFWFGAPGKASDVDRTVFVDAKDLSFDPTIVEVRSGETVRFVVFDVSEVEHDFTIGDSKTQHEHRVEMSKMTDMAAEHAHHVDPNAIFLKGGDTKDIVWRFGKAGQIEFGCNVPGHYEAGMKGTIAIR